MNNIKIRPSVAIIKEGKILLMRYEYGGENVFNLPGGNAETLESINETVERELIEELNLGIKTGKLLLVGETHNNIKNQTVLHLVFEAKIVSGTPIINPEHTTALEVVWKSVSEISHLNMYPNVGELLFEPYREGAYVGAIQQNWF